MSFDSKKQELSRQSCRMLAFDFDCCTNVYGQAPCTANKAAGAECYNTYTTCQDRPNYSKGIKTLKITDKQVGFPGPFPWLASINLMPTEIKVDPEDGQKELSIRGRATVSVLDEPHTDVGIDPYRANRTSVPEVSFWKRFLARNTNWQGRSVRSYEGFVGEPESEFQLRWAGRIDNILLGDSKVTFKLVDELKALKGIKLPAKFDGELNSDINAAAVDLILTTIEKLPASGYIVIEDEIIQYAAITEAQNKLTGLTRGALDTTAAAHDSGERVGRGIYFAPTNPFDILKGMLTDSRDPAIADPPGAGIDVARVNTAAFDAARDWPGGEVDFSTFIHTSTSLSDLFWEIVRLVDCHAWENEQQQITIKRNLPKELGQSYTEFTDGANIVVDSDSVDLNDVARKTAVALFWDLPFLSEIDDEMLYRSVDVMADVDAESENEFDGIAEDTLYCRWLRLSPAYIQIETIKAYALALITRRLLLRRDAHPRIEFAVELKDEGVMTGDKVRLTTDALLTPDGTPLNRALFAVFKRDPKGNRINYVAVQVAEEVKFAYVAPDAAPDYDVATEVDKESAYIGNDDGTMPDESPGYIIY